MSRHLIINARHRLAWHHRLFSDASTAMMWGGWLWLWSPLLRSFAAAGPRSHVAMTKLLANGSADAIERTVFALMGTSGVLLAWNRLFARRPRSAAPLSVGDYARHFELPEQDLHAGRGASICVVEHDDSGRIVRLQCRETSHAATGSAPALAATRSAAAAALTATGSAPAHGAPPPAVAVCDPSSIHAAAPELPPALGNAPITSRPRSARRVLRSNGTEAGI